MACHLSILLLLATSWKAPAQESDPTENDSIREELQELRSEVDDLRAWKQEQQDAATGQDGGSRFKFPGSIGLTISGEIRIREEFRRHVYSPQDPDGNERSDLTRMRTRLRFDFEVSDHLDAIVELQDARILGSEGSPIADSEGLDLKRAEIIIADLFGLPAELELGRFVMFYGKQRVIGHLEWFDQGRTFDGFRIKTHGDSWYADFFGARINDLGTSDEDDSDLIGLYAGTKELMKGFDLEGYILHARDQRDGTSETGAPGETGFTTFGGRWFGTCGGLDYETEIMFQTGEVFDDDLTAFGGVAAVGYKFEDCSMTPRLGFEIDYATGDRNPTDGETEQLQLLFPTNHIYYGRADLAALSNLWGFRTSLAFHPGETVRVALDHYHFSLQDEEGPWVNAGGATIRPGSRGASRHLGEEVDLTVWWDALDHLEIELGVNAFFGGGFTDDTGRQRDALFSYVQAHVKF